VEKGLRIRKFAGRKKKEGEMCTERRGIRMASI